jgi:transposase InsO family protein
VKYAFIQREQAQYPVACLCQVMGVARSGYYAWLKGSPTQREMANHQLAEQIREVHAQSRGTYGYPRVHAELRARGAVCTRKRVARLMRQQGLRGRRKRRLRVVTTDSRHANPVAPNLLNQEFQADAPDQKWCCDITYIPTQGGWLYLAIVLDLFSRKIVGWAMASHMQQTLVHDALNMALVRRQPPPGLLHHSDRGSQYTAYAYQDLLRQHQIEPSMSRKGNCYDNAPAESFFATLKEEIITQPFASHQEARSAVFHFIEVWYNRRRRHSALGFRSPNDFESTFAASSLSTKTG